MSTPMDISDMIIIFMVWYASKQTSLKCGIETNHTTSEDKIYSIKRINRDLKTEDQREYILSGDPTKHLILQLVVTALYLYKIMMC